MTICPLCSTQVLQLVPWNHTIISRLYPGSFETQRVYGCPSCQQKARRAQALTLLLPRNPGQPAAGWREAA